MKLLPTLLLSLLTITTLMAQPNLGSWQWANKQGGVNNTTSGDNEIVNDICTDKYGNVYVTGIVAQSPHFGNVIYTAPFSSFGRDDAFVAKYDKCGNLKWARFGGGIADDVSIAIHVDDSLNVYILGGLGSNSATFPDSTHTLTISNGQLFWAKYDSMGNIKWVKGTGNAAAYFTASETYPINLIKTPSGNLSTIILIGPGGFYPGLNFTATHNGLALFEFDLNGNPVNVLPIDSMVPSATTFLNHIYGMAYDSKGNIIYNFTLNDTTFIFDTVFKDNTSSFARYFTAKINHQTNKIIWIKEWKEDQYGETGFGSVLIDKDDNIILDGQGGRDAVFNGDSIKFQSTAATSMEVCFKLDSNGNTLWYIVADNTNSANVPVYEQHIALMGNQYICVPINVSGPTYWGGDTFNLSGSTYVMTFINTNTGKVEFGMPLTGSTTLNTTFQRIISDEQGNVYAGGYFSSNITAGNTISYTGGINDAFVLKWGLPCPDTDALVTPLAAEGLIASVSGAHAIDLTWHNVAQYADRYRVYRSTTDSLTGYSLIDSVSNSTTHYTDVNVVSHQIYWYRVSAVNHSGETYSNSDSAIIAPTGIDELSDIRHIALYPNPANTYTKLSVWSDATSSFSATISLTDIAGRESYVKQTEIVQGKNDFIIDISELSAGVYLVNLHCDNGTCTKRLMVIK